MFVRNVEIDNDRGFRELSLDLARTDNAGFAGWTAIAGRNGAGKTTLPQAIALDLTGGDSGQAIAENCVGWVRLGADHSAVRYELVRSDDDRVRAIEYSGDSNLDRGVVTRRKRRERALGRARHPVTGHRYTTPTGSTRVARTA